MHNYFLAFLSLFLLASSAFSQTITVKDKTTIEGIEFVTIYTENGNSTITDLDGNADLSILLPADTIFFQQVGYEPLWTLSSELSEERMVFLEPSTFSIGEVVVSANRWSQDERKVVSSIAHIPVKDINLLQPQTTADLLGQSGQIFIQKSQMGGGSPMIRGFAANRLLISVDGVRMNTAIFRSGNLQNVISIDPFALQQAEVILGPSSVAYGSDAIGGVMAFETRTPMYNYKEGWRTTGQAGFRYSSANQELGFHANLEAGTRKFGSFTSVSFSDFGNLKMGKHGPDDYLRNEFQVRVPSGDTLRENPNPRNQVPSGYKQYNLMQKFRFAAKDGWDLNYSFHFTNTTDIPRYDRLIQPSGDGFRSAEWYYGPQTWMMHHFNFVRNQAAKAYSKMRLSMAYQYFEESRNDRRFGSDELRMRTENVRIVTLNADFEKEINERHEIDYGIEGLMNFVNSEAHQMNIETGELSAISTRYPDGSNWSSLAGFLSYQFNISPKLNFQAAARYNHFWISADFDTSFYPFPFTSTMQNTGSITGNVGIAWNPNPSWTIRAGISSGFRAPNIDDIGKVFDSEPGSVIVPNPDLKPENAYQFELGIDKRFGDFMLFQVDAYYTKLVDAMVRDEFQLNGEDSIIYDGELSQVQAIQNSGKAYVWGVELGLNVDLPAGFGLQSRYNYQTGEERRTSSTELVPLRHVAPMFGISAITYDRKQMRFELSVQYAGEIAFEDLAPSERDKAYLYAEDENGNPYSPRWYSLNLRSFYQLGKNIMLSLGLENITNRRYRPYSSGIAATGINFSGSLRARF